jgi:hypothetical protein
MLDEESNNLITYGGRYGYLFVIDLSTIFIDTLEFKDFNKELKLAYHYDNLDTFVE